MTVLFDLDNTLYSEFSFVLSGFRATAEFLASRHAVDGPAAAARMQQILEAEGRGHVFDRLLEELRLGAVEHPATLLYVYRTHVPSLRVYEGVRPLLGRLRQSGARLGIVTDGLASVQRRKIQALDLASLVDVVVCTGELENAAKPSPVPFQVALRLLDARPHEAVYVGDDDTKDFSGPHALGMDTVQLLVPGERPLRTGGPGSCSPARRVARGFAELEDCLLNPA